MKKYKTTLSVLHCNWLLQTIEQAFKLDEINYITIAALGEVALVIRKKMVVYERQYKIVFSAVQALALVELYDLLNAPVDGNDFTNRLLQVHNEVLQLYSV